MKIYKYKLESVKFGQVKEIQICGTEILSCGPLRRRHTR